MWPASVVVWGAVLLLMLTIGCHADTTRYNVSFDELHKCKQHNAINGYNYRAFFKLHELEHNNPNDTDGLIVDLLVYVLAARDGHILLSEQNKTAVSAVEIVLGGGGNTFSQIRLGQKGSPLRTKASAGLLSPIDPLPVRVRIDTEGQIRVYAGNLTDEPFMETLMPKEKASELRYVSFTTWGTALAKWFYDCPLPSNESNGTVMIDGNELEQEYDGKQRLLDHLKQVPRWIDPPVNFTGVEIGQIFIEGFVYDQMTNLVELSGMIGMSWQDSRYRWNASDFDNTTLVGDVCHTIWTPSFEPLSLFTGSFSLCYLSHKGNVIAAIDKFSWANFCSLSDSYRWPYDANACHLQLMAASHERHVPIRLDMKQVRFVPDYEQSEWSVKTVAKHEYEQNITPYGQQPMLELHFEMIRKSDIHSMSIYPAYFVANLLISISFLTDGRSRLLLNSLGLIVLLNTFLSISVIVPRSGIPKICTVLNTLQFSQYFFSSLQFSYILDIFFRWSLVFFSLSLLFFVIDLWLKRTRVNIPPNSWINRLISFPVLRFALAMDQISNYNTLEHKNVRWDEVTRILNRIMMIVVVIVFAIGFTKP
uniref:Neurotransmitter-gated ion-channel ligand-binding domain-containing protein n=1 Tax=Anopheles epiroticus TaxID=199890 RepID=A0A182P8G7_9DIPT